MKKSSVLEVLSLFEDEFEVEELIEKLIFVDKVTQGIKAVQEGNIIDFEKVKKRFS